MSVSYDEKSNISFLSSMWPVLQIGTTPPFFCFYRTSDLSRLWRSSTGDWFRRNAHRHHSELCHLFGFVRRSNGDGKRNIYRFRNICLNANVESVYSEKETHSALPILKENCMLRRRDCRYTKAEKDHSTLHPGFLSETSKFQQRKHQMCQQHEQRSPDNGPGDIPADVLGGCFGTYTDGVTNVGKAQTAHQLFCYDPSGSLEK